MQSNYYIDDEEVKAKTLAAAARLTRIASLMCPSDSHVLPAGSVSGRNVFVRAVDVILAAVRGYAPPVHWLVVVTSAIVLFIYARLVGLTVRLRTAGARPWPDVPAPCVVALWHGDAPSLLVAFARRRPGSRCVIMIARDPRGDCLTLLCRMLGFAVVRGGGTNGGWNALTELAQELARGACVFVTADGGGPARVAKVGAVALASATLVPLVSLTADCHPAIEERHKWDSARIPVPFGSVKVSAGLSHIFKPFMDASSFERARKWLQETLNVPDVAGST